MNLKLVGKNTVIYGIGNIGLRASAFLLIPLYTHTLSISEYGLLATLLLTVQLMVIVMSAGMRTSFLRFVEEYRAGNLIGHLLGSSLLINVIAGIIVAGATLIFLESFFCAILHVDHVTEYLALTSCAALFQTLSLHLMTYYQANNNALKFTLVGASAALLLFITNLILLLIFQLGIKGALIANIVTYNAVLLFLLFDILFKKTGIAISFTMIPKLLRFGCPLIFSMLGQIIMGSSSIYFLSHWEGLEVVAIYSLGYKLATVVGMVLTLPRLDLMQMVKRAALITDERSNSVRFSFSAGQITVSAVTPEVGEAREEMPMEYDGPDLEIAFNPHFIIDVLKALDEEEEIQLKLIDSNSPGILKTDGRFLCVIMPMKL